MSPGFCDSSRDCAGAEEWYHNMFVLGRRQRLNQFRKHRLGTACVKASYDMSDPQGNPQLSRVVRVK
jgi:hypothetical protein